MFWVGCAVLVGLTIEAFVRGDWAYTALLVPVALFIAWLLWIVLFRPKLSYNAERAVVINIGRTHVIPWGRIAAVRQRLNITFELVDGSTLSASAVTASRGGGNVLRGITSNRLGDPSVGFDLRAETLDALRDAAAPSDAPVVSRWDTLALGIGAVLAVAAVIALIVALL